MTYHGNRGAAFENFVMSANNYYSSNRIARVDKVATPVRVVSLKSGMITRAFFEKKSTVDFVGCSYNGKMIAFDCKETANDRFPLGNIERHQYEYLEQIDTFGGHAFILVFFSKLFRFFRLDFQTLKTYWVKKECGGSKRGTCSITYNELADREIRINGMILDYLAGLK